MKKNVIILLLIFFTGSLWAQSDSIVTMSGSMSQSTAIKSDRPMHRLTEMSHLRDTLQPWELHLSMGSGCIGSRFNSASVFGIMPSVVYRPSDKFALRASAAFLHSYSLAPGGYEIHGRRPRSMAPLRNQNAMAMALSVSASYKVSDRLWLAGQLMHVGGGIASGAVLNPWFAPDMPVDLNATAFTAAMRYKLGDNSFLDIHMTYIKDRTGALGPLLFGGPYGSPFYYESTTFGSHLFE